MSSKTKKACCTGNKKDTVRVCLKFNDGRVVYVDYMFSCPDLALAFDRLVDLCDVDFFEGLDFSSQKKFCHDHD